MSDELDINYDEPAILPDDEIQARERVEWHARMVRYHTARRDEETASYEREIERLRTEVQHRKQVAQKQIDWHTAPIKSYHKMRQQEDDKLKTLRMPHATSKLPVPKKPVITVNSDIEDYDQAVINWMYDNHPDGLQIPGVTVLRSCADVLTTKDDDGNVTHTVVDKETGEILPFLKAEIPEPKYTLTPEEGTPL